MDKIKYYSLLLSKFPHPPTSGQKKSLYALAGFITSEKTNFIFVLKGYAGTGKTTVVSTIVNSLNTINKKPVLLAPTGRAAKVLASYSGQKAFTIHKKIYVVATGPDGSLRLALAENKHRNTIFLVDESSMIPDRTASDSAIYSGNSLLDDLMDYVHSGVNNKLVLIGDTAQLPPVNLESSPALDDNYLKNSYSFSVYSIELTEVVRQSLESGILANATTIRNLNEKEGIKALIQIEGFDDIIRINGEMLEEALNDNYNGNDWTNTVVVTRSNKRANIFNQEIRNRILYRESEISAGDLLMIVKNNYFWVDKNSKPGFLANGDIIEILKIIRYEDLYEFRFAEVVVKLLDYPDEAELTVKINLDTLMVEGPSLSNTDNRKLFDEVMKDYEDQPSRRIRMESVKNNPYYNALQVKFAYALTCHKTQGGQWENVFIDLGYLNEDHVNISFYRWLYTAFTRATNKLYLINFPESFFT